MTPPWGINWQRYHADRDDMPHIEKMGYRSFTIYEWMWSNRDFCNELLSVARKDAIFLNRDHPLSEQKDDQWKSDPKLKGRNHADEWAQKVREGKVYTPLDRTYFLGLNEPDSNHFQRQIDTYNEAYCRRLYEHGLRAAAYSFGVGHPSTVDLQPKTPPDWSWYKASAAAVLEGHHLVATHEYGAPTQGGYGWEFWCNRISFCPYPFDVIYDECGIDNGVLQSGVLKGYAEFMTGEEYCRWLDGFQAGIAERAPTRKVNLLGYNIFGFDHGSSDEKDWHSFDIRPMRKLLEAFQWSDAPVPTTPPPVPTTPPPAPTGPTATPVTPAGSRIRSGPGKTYSVLGAVPTGQAMRVTGRNEDASWWQVDSPFGSGWVSTTVVETHNTLFGVPVVGDGPTPAPQPEPAPPPAPEPSDKWGSSLAFTARWEGGYQNVENDAGNWTGGAVGVGENKGTNWGVSAASYPHLDIKNLSREQAHEIFKRDFWEKSGASQLDWPACLIVFDSSILHGVGTAKAWLADVGPDPYAFAAKRLRAYTKMGNWDFWGKSWVLRVSDLLEECSR